MSIIPGLIFDNEILGLNKLFKSAIYICLTSSVLSYETSYVSVKLVGSYNIIAV